MIRTLSWIADIAFSVVRHGYVANMTRGHFGHDVHDPVAGGTSNHFTQFAK